jgi:two-component system chemotaxis sensor kinase CheA
MGLSSEIRQQLINTFKTEQSEHLQQISQGLLALEQNPTPDEQARLLSQIFREAHSLKGAARAVGLTTIESLGHHLEGILLKAKGGELAFTAELFDLLYQTLDAIEVMMVRFNSGDTTTPIKVLGLLTRLEETTQAEDKLNRPTSKATEVRVDAPEPPPEPSTAPAGLNLADPVPPAILPETDSNPPKPAEVIATDKTTETIRVSVSKLDALMAQVSELLVTKIRAEQRLTEVQQLQLTVNNWYKESMSVRTQPHWGQRNGRHPTLKPEVMAQQLEPLRGLNSQVNTLYRQFSNDTMRLSLLLNELQEEIKRVRMQPLAMITTTFGRMVRDLARQQNKRITLTMRGVETELDKRVLEQIKDPLIHLLRNAVDHGLETTTERQQAGKPEEGHIQLTAGYQGNNVVITVADDGRGLDLASVRQAAVRKGALSRLEVDKLSEAEATMLIFHPGLSTSKIITDISGRGVGLDVVRQNIEALQGSITVQSKLGQGTTFTMTLPLTLVSSRGLLVQSAGQTFALPLAMVERLVRVEAGAVSTVEGKEVFIHDSQPVPLSWLEDILELPLNPRNRRHWLVVIVAATEKRLGLVVDALLGEQEIVIKGLGPQLVKVGGIAGATVLGSGQVILVLQVADLIKLAARAQARANVASEFYQAPEATVAHKTILVVDDSITTRTLEKNILEAAGYQVKLATNGQEALNSLAKEDLPHLVVTDVNMPKVDGFELTSRMKQDKRYAHIPIILVTSLDSAADKARGIEVGADAYIIKSRFDQGNLLEIIEQLV